MYSLISFSVLYGCGFLKEDTCVLRSACISLILSLTWAAEYTGVLSSTAEVPGLSSVPDIMVSYKFDGVDKNVIYNAKGTCR